MAKNTPAAAPAKPKKEYKYPLVNGHKIHFRKVQMTLWGVILGLLLGAAFIAGLYWLGLQQNWGGSAAHPISLKEWWDAGMGFIHSGNWDLYRHSIRNQIEPAAGTILVLSFLFGVKANAKQKKVHGLFTLFGLGIMLIVVAVAGAVGETWLIYFGIPDHLNHGHPLTKYVEIAVAFALGFVLGKILHYIWMPAAATVQYHLVEGPLSRGVTPLWVRLALAPPTLRERFADLQERVRKSEITLDAKDAPSGAFRIVVSIALFLYLVVAVIGNIAKFWIARGNTVPLLHS